MSLQVTCPNGHSYDQSDLYLDWPPTLPKCPVCREIQANSKIIVQYLDQLLVIQEAMKRILEGVDSTHDAIEELIVLIKETYNIKT